MANTNLTIDKITQEALRVLHNKLSFIGTINRQYDDQFAKSGGKIGDTLRIKLPNEFTVATGANLVTQEVTTRKVDLTVATQKHIGMKFSSSELTMDIDNFSDQYIKPAMSVMAANIEADALTMALDIPQIVGTPGTTPSALSTILAARKRMNQFLAPKDDNRFLQIDSTMSASMVDTLKGLFQDSGSIAKQYKEGMIGRTSGFKWFENELIPNHTSGTQDATTPVVNGASQSGSSLIVDGFDASATMTKGTVFTMVGVNAVHPETKADYGFLKEFVVTADATADGAGDVTLSISPSIYTDGALQNVTAGPADDAAIVFVTLSGVASAVNPNNIAYHKDAFTFVTADLDLPPIKDASRKVFDGISMRCVRQFDINTDTTPLRIDVLYGFKTIRPELACRIVG